MDAAEIYAPLRERLRQTVALISALLLGAAACLGLFWRQQLIRFYQERYSMAEALRVSDLRYRRLFEAAKEGILIFDAETGVIMDANPFLLDLLNSSRDEFLGKKVWELSLFKNLANSEANFMKLQHKENLRAEDMPLAVRRDDRQAAVADEPLEQSRQQQHGHSPSRFAN